MVEAGVRPSVLILVQWDGVGSAVPAGQSARYAIAWPPDGLYVYVEVVDPSRLPAVPAQGPWCGDGVEVYVDADGVYMNAPDYDDPGALQFVTEAPGVAGGVVKEGSAYCIGCAGGGGPLPIEQLDYVAVARSDGYALEMFVAGGDLGLATWTLAAGGTVGVDLAVNVSAAATAGEDCQGGGPDGNRLGQYFLRVHPSEPAFPFITAEAFCTAALVD